MVFVLMGNNLAPFYGKPHSRGTHFQPLGHLSNRHAKLADSPKTEWTPPIKSGSSTCIHCCQAIEEILSIPVVYEYLSTLYPPDYDVVQHAGRLPAISCARPPSARLRRLPGGLQAPAGGRPTELVLAWHRHKQNTLSTYVATSVPFSLSE